MGKRLSFLLLFLLMLGSCNKPAFLSNEKKYPPSDNKVWYSQNEKEDYPNIEIATRDIKLERDDYVGYIIYKTEKIKIDVSLGFALEIGFKKYGEESPATDWCWLSYEFRYKENKIVLNKKNASNTDKFGFNFNDYLPFNLYIKDFDKDEWYSKYPEDKADNT